MAVEVNNLHFSYQDTPILENVNLDVKKGEFICIFGPNGGGKTTLLYLLMGFLKPMKGHIAILGKDVKESRKHIGFVPQNFHFDRFFPISVEEVVLEGRLSTVKWHGHFNKIDKKFAKEALHCVNMTDFIKYPFAALSGGQQQRVLIARALANEPTILLLDEPTASVDTGMQLEIYNLLKSLKSKMTVIMVTHDLSNAIDAVDKLYCIQKTLVYMSKEEVCDHFSIGLYHPPGKKI